MMDWLRGVPGLLPLLRKLRAMLGIDRTQPFAGSAGYWRQRYAGGGDSGAGSYGRFAQFKADVLNGLCAEFDLRSMVEFGCGDGNQARLLSVRDYLGIDISPDAIERCVATFAGVPGRRFALIDDYKGERADCALSLDVIYHLVEDTAFDQYMRGLFAAAERCVVIYSSNRDEPSGSDGPHVRHRRFSDWVETHQRSWALVRHVPNEFPYRGDWRTGSFADFYVYVPSAEHR